MTIALFLACTVQPESPGSASESTGAEAVDTEKTVEASVDSTMEAKNNELTVEATVQAAISATSTAQETVDEASVQALTSPTSTAQETVDVDDLAIITGRVKLGDTSATDITVIAIPFGNSLDGSPPITETVDADGYFAFKIIQPNKYHWDSGYVIDVEVISEEVISDVWEPVLVEPVSGETMDIGDILKTTGSLTVRDTRPPTPGYQLFATNCSACHSTGDDKIIGPGLAGIGDRAGSRVDGLNADEYLAQSLREPDAFIVDGFTPGLMPNWEKLGDDSIDALVTYLKTLK